MPRLAVITRTKDRPDLLDRTLDSLFTQVSNDFVWIIANDGQTSSRLEATITRAQERVQEVKCVTVVGSRGMESATNQALAVARTPFITLLDDDDTWEPTFISETMAFLDSHPQYAGVCTQSHIVLETDALRPKQLDRYVMNPKLQSVTLADLILFNQWTNNAFVYRREVHESLGLYREDLRVLGDWEFGLRFLARFDIGVIPEPLANYHQRTGLANPRAANANSVVAELNEHLQVEARIRNEYLRQDLISGQIGMGFLLALGRMQCRSSIEQHRAMIRAIDERRLSRRAKKLARSLLRKISQFVWQRN